MPVIKKSDGTTTLTGGGAVRVETARQMVQQGHAVVTTPGASGFDVVKLVNAAQDTAYSNATNNAKVQAGVSHIRFMPQTFPES